MENRRVYEKEPVYWRRSENLWVLIVIPGPNGIWEHIWKGNVVKDVELSQVSPLLLFSYLLAFNSFLVKRECLISTPREMLLMPLIPMLTLQLLSLSPMYFLFLQFLWIQLSMLPISKLALLTLNTRQTYFLFLLPQKLMNWWTHRVSSSTVYSPFLL